MIESFCQRVTLTKLIWTGAEWLSAVDNDRGGLDIYDKVKGIVVAVVFFRETKAIAILDMETREVFGNDGRSYEWAEVQTFLENRYQRLPSGGIDD